VGEQGHQIGNHSELHLNLNKDSVTSQQYIDGIQRAEHVFQPLKGWTARYRYPFLKEGNTLEKRACRGLFTATWLSVGCSKY
jgi:peptidoglycan/xylan/chitin deacetylase (PgdA/CDA1 family)